MSYLRMYVLQGGGGLPKVTQAPCSPDLLGSSWGLHGALLGPSWRTWALLVTLLGASWSILACLACLVGLSCAIFVDLGAIFTDFVYILVDLGSIFADLATLRVELSPARELDFHVFAMLRERSLSAICFWRACEPENGPRRLFGVAWETFGVVLGPSCALLGRSCVLRRSWDVIGMFLGCF